MTTLTDLSNALTRLDEERGDLAAVCRALANAIGNDDGLWDAVRNCDALEALVNALEAIGEGD